MKDKLIAIIITIIIAIIAFIFEFFDNDIVIYTGAHKSHTMFAPIESHNKHALATLKSDPRLNKIGYFTQNVIGYPSSKLLKLIKSNKPDSFIVDDIIKHKKHESEKELIEKEEQYYEKTMHRNVKRIKSIVDKSNIPYPHTILDIGTENIKTLKYMDEVFGTNTTAYGINIRNGFNHYNEKEYLKNDEYKNFKFYDGTNIPDFEDITQYDLATSFYVLHHIPPDLLLDLIKSMSKKCKYVLIKENDNKNKQDEILSIWQHYVYDIILRNHKKMEYLNTSCNEKYFVDIFNNYGFKLLYKEGPEGWTNTVYLLFENTNLIH